MSDETIYASIARSNICDAALQAVREEPTTGGAGDFATNWVTYFEQVRKALLFQAAPHGPYRVEVIANLPWVGQPGDTEQQQNDATASLRDQMYQVAVAAARVPEPTDCGGLPELFIQWWGSETQLGTQGQCMAMFAHIVLLYTAIILTSRGWHLSSVPRVVSAAARALLVSIGDIAGLGDKNAVVATLGLARFLKNPGIHTGNVHSRLAAHKGRNWGAAQTPKVGAAALETLRGISDGETIERAVLDNALGTRGRSNTNVALAQTGAVIAIFLAVHRALMDHTGRWEEERGGPGWEEERGGFGSEEERGGFGSEEERSRQPSAAAPVPLQPVSMLRNPTTGQGYLAQSTAHAVPDPLGVASVHASGTRGPVAPPPPQSTSGGRVRPPSPLTTPGSVASVRASGTRGRVRLPSPQSTSIGSSGTRGRVRLPSPQSTSRGPVVLPSTTPDGVAPVHDSGPRGRVRLPSPWPTSRGTVVLPSTPHRRAPARLEAEPCVFVIAPGAESSLNGFARASSVNYHAVNYVGPHIPNAQIEGIAMPMENVYNLLRQFNTMRGEQTELCRSNNCAWPQPTVLWAGSKGGELLMFAIWKGWQGATVVLNNALSRPSRQDRYDVLPETDGMVPADVPLYTVLAGRDYYTLGVHAYSVTDRTRKDTILTELRGTQDIVFPEATWFAVVLWDAEHSMDWHEYGNLQSSLVDAAALGINPKDLTGSWSIGTPRLTLNETITPFADFGVDEHLTGVSIFDSAQIRLLTERCYERY